ncbi:MAG: Asp-tRNA(Asn)/Glu-tRNA(Gln) amidotransferase subunit GatA [Bacteroidota bacterium]
MQAPKYATYQAVRQAIEEERTNCQELVDYYLAQIEVSTATNAYVEVFAEEAKVQAKALDEKRAAQPDGIGRLFGAVISIKDVLCYKDHEVTASSKILGGFRSLFTATAVERLLAEDAIIIGRTSCDEFAMGSSNENSYYGPVKNGASLDRVPGGSSGGSAVAVQMDTCLASLGSDTGGSVRQPAAFCGVVGMKPTYGRVSRYGLLAYGSSFDQIGVLSHSVEDAALLLEIMAGNDPMDSTSSHRPVPAYSKELVAKERYRIAYFGKALESEGMHADIRKATHQLIEDLQHAGHTVASVDFDLLDHIIAAYYVLTTAEASTNLSRYDGIRYGYRSSNAQDLMETYKKSRTEGFGAEVKRRIMLGTFVLSSGYYDAYYTKAQKARRLIQERTNAIFEDYDFILAPASPTPPWKIGEKEDDPVSVYLEDIFTVQANMTGIPAICWPVGTDEAGLPIGMQLMAPRFAEQELLAFAKGLNGQ